MSLDKEITYLPKYGSFFLCFIKIWGIGMISRLRYFLISYAYVKFSLAFFLDFFLFFWLSQPNFLINRFLIKNTTCNLQEYINDNIKINQDVKNIYYFIVTTPTTTSTQPNLTTTSWVWSDYDFAPPPPPHHPPLKLLDQF